MSKRASWTKLFLIVGSLLGLLFLQILWNTRTQKLAQEVRALEKTLESERLVHRHLLAEAKRLYQPDQILSRSAESAKKDYIRINPEKIPRVTFASAK
jgi:cell division protein FtsL